MALKPLPQALFAADRLRKIAADLILEAEELEASAMPEYQAKKNVEFIGTRKKAKGGKP